MLNVDEFDGVVVGAGAAGLIAALRAATLGAHIALIEAEDGSTSNLAVSGGLFPGAGTRFQAPLGIADSPELWEADIRRKTDDAVDAVVLRAVTSRSADVVDFLSASAGLDLHLVQWLDVPGHTVPRLHATPAESGRELAVQLLASVRAHGRISCFMRTTVQALVTEHARVCGVTSSAGIVRAPLTVLASGGFAANADMLARFIPEVVHAIRIGSGSNDGRAILWGAALGAELLFMDSYQGQGHTTVDGKGRLGPGLTTLGAIVVNSAGVRFADDTMGPSEFAASVLSQPGGWAAEVYDSAIHEAALRLGPYREAVARGCVAEAPTVESLAVALGLPKDALAGTIMAFNGMVSAGSVDPFGRTRLHRPLGLPLYGARITGALAHTQGGLRVDEMARVLRADGTPIAGLMAAGGAAASVSGHGATGYVPGNGLGQAFALGLIAGEGIANHRRAARDETGPLTMRTPRARRRTSCRAPRAAALIGAPSPSGRG